MKLTRRRFLAGAVLAAIAAGAAWRRRGELLRALFASSPPPARPGALRESTLGVLRATVDTLLEGHAEPEPYLAQFRFRAETLPGYRAQYERFERSVDADARAHGRAGFRSAPPALRARILARRLPAAGWRRAARALFQRDDDRDARFVIRPIFRRFARTDAYLIAGYGAWPGQPRAIAHPGAPGEKR